MVGLIGLRYKFPAWPTHPVGFTSARGVADQNLSSRRGRDWSVQERSAVFPRMLVGFTFRIMLNYSVDMT